MAMSLIPLLVLVLLLPVDEARVSSAMEDDVARRLKLSTVAGFQPITSIADYASIDLDQQAIMMYLAEHSEEGFHKARQVYEKGAFSRSFATLKLDKELPDVVHQYTKVSGITIDAVPVKGEILRSAQKGAKIIDVLYDTDDADAATVGCKVGGNPEPVFDGCFAPDGAIEIEGIDFAFPYYYNQTADNQNDRTIESMSTNAYAKLKGCGSCDYFQDFAKFVAYYGKANFADLLIEGAFNGEVVPMKHGDWDFSHFDQEARAAFIEKVTAYINIGHYVLREMETAFAKCENRSPCPKGDERCEHRDLHLMEGAVGFYAGSLEGHDGGGNGVLLYDLADALGSEFKTSGEDGDSTKGTSKVNLDIIAEFQKMQGYFIEHKCTAGRHSIDRIAALLFVPLIQATLRQAFVMDKRPGTSLTDEAVGAAYAASVIPIVAKCSHGDGQILFENMKPRRENPTDFSAVKEVFERNYRCLRINCDDVGGYFYGGLAGIGQHYYDGAEPCPGLREPKHLSFLQKIGIAIGVIVFLMLACVCYAFRRLPRRSKRSKKSRRSTKAQLHRSTGVSA